MRNKASVTIFALCLILSLITLDGCYQAAQDPSFDLIIKGGRIYDGSAAKPTIADIGIKGDKIAAIGSFSGKATKTINAQGLIVTPGFIDVHSHTDLFLKSKGIGRVIAYIKPGINGNHNYLYQGVTTIVTGSSGQGYANTAKWLGWVDSLRFGVNVYHLAPLDTIREEMFGWTDPHNLTEKQKEILKRRLIKEVENGAAGFSLDLSKKSNSTITTDDLIEIARSIKPFGGIFVVDLRNTSGGPDAEGNRPLLRSLQDALEIGRQTGIALQISSLELKSPWNNLTYSQLNKIIREARREGIDVTVDQSPYDADFNSLIGLLPAEFLTGKEIKKEYKTSEGESRALILKAINKIFTGLSPDKFLIVNYPLNKSYEGKSIRQIATLENRSPADCYWEMAVAANPPLVVVSDSSEQFAKKLMTGQFVFTASEGLTYLGGNLLIHPGYFGAFTHKLRKYALEDKIISLNDAIRSMTTLPAQKFNIKGRGQIAVGNFADIAVIDLKKLKDKATFMKPREYSEGVEYLVVNGILSIDKGRITGKKGGKAQKRI
jgi:N-acyl-D-amino-acid deacylase